MDIILAMKSMAPQIVLDVSSKYWRERETNKQQQKIFKYLCVYLTKTFGSPNKKSFRKRVESCFFIIVIERRRARFATVLFHLLCSIVELDHKCSGSGGCHSPWALKEPLILQSVSVVDTLEVCPYPRHTSVQNKHRSSDQYFLHLSGKTQLMKHLHCCHSSEKCIN